MSAMPWSSTAVIFRSDIARSRHRKLGVLIQIAISGSVCKSLKPSAPTFSGTNRYESVPGNSVPREASFRMLTTSGSSVHPIQSPKPRPLAGALSDYCIYYRGFAVLPRILCILGPRITAFSSSSKGTSPLGPLDSEGAQHRQTHRPSCRRDPQ